MKIKLFLIAILTLGFLLRTAFLDRYPATLYGDEQAFAWNAYNILKLGTDEYGNPFPLQFRSFDDYKAPVPVYLLVPFIKFLGLNPFAIRLPIAIFSALTIILSFKLTKVFLNNKISLLVSYLLAVSPWHVHLSRGFFEATLSLFFFTTGIYFFLKSNSRLKSLLVSMIFFSLSLYSYFTPRIIIPIFLLFLAWYSKLLKNKNYWLSLLFLVMIAIPLIKLSFLDQGLSRFYKLNESMNRIIVEAVNKERYASNLPQEWRLILHNKATVWMRVVTQNYLEHLSLNFWYLFGDNSLRYFLGSMGMFYLIEMPFMIYGLYLLWSEKKRIAIFFLIWVLLSPIPASLVGRPFALRSLQMLPAPFIFVGYGIKKLLLLFSNSSTSREPLRVTPEVSLRQYLFSSIIVFGFILSLGSLLVRYYLEYPVYAATWWGWENKAAIDYALARESQYDKIFISNFYSGVTLAYAVYMRLDPLEYRYAINHPEVIADNKQLIRFGKFYFGSLDLDTVRVRNKIIPAKSLYIGRPEEPEGEARIVAPDDGRLIFVVHDTLQKQ